MGPSDNLIEEGGSQSVDLQRVTSGRIFKSVAPEAKDAEHETVVADEPEGRTKDRFEQALVRLEARQTMLATSLQRSLLAFVLIIGFLLLARGSLLLMQDGLQSRWRYRAGKI